MTTRLESISEIAPDYDAIICDQWGVLHDGTRPYEGSIDVLRSLASQGVQLAVLSNSGKSAASNSERISKMGFGGVFREVMTSGEALWQDIAAGRIAERRLFPIEREVGDARKWAAGLDIELTADVLGAEAILLMGLPDGDDLHKWRFIMDAELPLYCSNPDRASPRQGGTVISPGALAHEYEKAGGAVTYYGKPHRPVFTALERLLDGTRFLMIGDSLEHDVLGAQDAGWECVFVEGGLHSQRFHAGDPDAALKRLVIEEQAQTPNFTMASLR